MNEQLNALALAMIGYEDSIARIQHFTKVHAYSRLIGQLEGLNQELLFTLETAAYVHDIGIKPAWVKYGSSAGPYQEELGPEIAEKLLTELNFDPKVIDRVAYLVGHHHTYDKIDGLDYQILVEADFLVNLFEDNLSKEAAQHAYDSIFKTESGKRICREMFAL
jgi:HD superfamily phosphodiesterase